MDKKGKLRLPKQAQAGQTKIGKTNLVKVAKTPNIKREIIMQLRKSLGWALTGLHCGSCYKTCFRAQNYSVAVEPRFN